jgi:hypothetical protein
VALSERGESVDGAADERGESVDGAADERAPSVDAEVIGSPPANATHWQLRRQTAGGWSRCDFAAGDGDVAVAEWPLGELSLATVRRRWGAGTYRVVWMASTPKRKPCGTGRPFILKPPAPRPVAPPAPRPVAPPAPAPAAVPAVAPGMAAMLSAMGGELGALAPALMLFQFISGQAQEQADRVIARERLALERDLARERERSEESRAFFREMAAVQQRGGAAQSAAMTKVMERIEALGERFEELDELVASASAGGGGGDGSGGAAALVPLLMGVLQQGKKGE